MFEPTLPHDNAELMALSDFRRLQDEAARARSVDAGTTRLTSLSATLLDDLRRFEPTGRDGDGLEALEGLAAAVRHGRSLRLHLLGLTGSLGAAVDRLQRRFCNVSEIASWPGFDRERATRLLNALYLQAALMVSRTHPAAINEDRPVGPAH